MKLAIIKGNRDLVQANVKRLKSALKENGKYIKKIHVVDPNKFTNYEYVDFITGKDISTINLKDYIAIVDGQHRAKAWIDSNKDQEKIPYEDVSQEVINCKLDLIDYIAQINSGKPWSKQDHMNAQSRIQNSIVSVYNKFKATWCPSALKSMMTVFDKKTNKDFDQLLKSGNSVDLSKEAPKKIHDALEKAGFKKKIGQIYFPEFIQKKYEETKTVKNRKPEDALDEILAVIELFDKKAVNKIESLTGKKHIMDQIQMEYVKVISTLNAKSK
jgi:hypothetical protein